MEQVSAAEDVSLKGVMGLKEIRQGNEITQDANGQ